MCGRRLFGNYDYDPGVADDWKVFGNLGEWSSVDHNFRFTDDPRIIENYGERSSVTTMMTFTF